MSKPLSRGGGPRNLIVIYIDLSSCTTLGVESKPFAVLARDESKPCFGYYLNNLGRSRDLSSRSRSTPCS